MTLTPEDIKIAYSRIKDRVPQTSILESEELNKYIGGGHRIIFKAENEQPIKAFKLRGAYNAILQYKEEHGNFPEHIAAFSSGNHAQAVALVAKELGIKATIFMPESTPHVKRDATKNFGGDNVEVIITKDRHEAEKQSASLIKSKNAFFLPPFDNDMIIAGQGTATYEALKIQDVQPSVILAACGGGGLLSGTILAAQLISPETKIFGAEPLNANDATLSLQSGRIHKLEMTPNTIADGVMTPCLSERTFAHLKNLDGMIETSEDNIKYWTRWTSKLLNDAAIEPTGAVAMAAAAQWLATQKEPQTIMVIISGGNISEKVKEEIWDGIYLETTPDKKMEELRNSPFKTTIISLKPARSGNLEAQI